MRHEIQDIIEQALETLDHNEVFINFSPEFQQSIIYNAVKNKFEKRAFQAYPLLPEALSKEDVITAIIKYVQESLIFSTTSPRILDEEQKHKPIRKNVFLEGSVSSIVGKLFSFNRPTSFEHTAELALRYSYGNCGERALVAAQALKVNGLDSELLRLVGHHIFLVVGRDTDTPINDHTKWNKDVIVVDLLSEKFFSVVDFEKEIFARWLSNDEIPQLALWTTVKVADEGKKERLQIKTTPSLAAALTTMGAFANRSSNPDLFSSGVANAYGCAPHPGSYLSEHNKTIGPSPSL